MEGEQSEGPLSVSKNSLYYQTKFEVMSEEIEGLRQQLRDRDSDYKKLREEASGSGKRGQLRRAITIECESVNQETQLQMVQQEAERLRDKLDQMEKDNNQLVRENNQLQLVNSRRSSVGQGSTELDQSLTLESNQNSHSQCVSDMENKEDCEARTYSDLEYENLRLITELSYYRQSRPDVGEWG